MGGIIQLKEGGGGGGGITTEGGMGWVGIIQLKEECDGTEGRVQQGCVRHFTPFCRCFTFRCGLRLERRSSTLELVATTSQVGSLTRLRELSSPCRKLLTANLEAQHRGSKVNSA